MSQHDMDVANGAGVVVRADINAALQALASLSSGSSAPSPSFPCQLWADTGTSRLKRRNAANSAWVDEGPLDAALRDAASQGEFVADTGSANAYVCNFVPTLTARSESTPLRFKVANANSAASTINDGVGTVALVGTTHAALIGGELVANGIAWIQWNATVGAYVLLFCTGAAGPLVNQVQTAFTTAGTAPAFTLTPAPAIGGYATNQRFRVKFNAAAATSGTLNVSGLGAKNLKQYDSTGAKVTAIIASGQLADVEYDGTDMVVLNPIALTATEVVKGVLRLATSSEAVQGLLNSVGVHPLGLAAALTALLPKRTFSTNDYIRIPDVPGGLIIQFGQFTSSSTPGAAVPVTLPVTYPNGHRQTLLTPQVASASSGSAWWDSPALNGFNGRSSYVSATMAYISIGN